MSSIIVISMKTYAVLGRFIDNGAAAEECHEANTPAYSIVDGDLSQLSGPDLVRIFNATPGVKPVTRFADRSTAHKRVMEVLNNQPPPALEPSPAEVLGDFLKPTITPEQETQPVKTKKGRKAKNPPKAKTARAPRVNGEAMKVELTAAGRKDDIRFNAESPRSQVFAAVKKAGDNGILLDTLEKKFEKMTRAQVLGCVQKLKAKGYVKVVAS